MPKTKKNAKEEKSLEIIDNCFGCEHYSYDIQKTSLPVMRNKVFYKISMKCHKNNVLKVLNERYENVYPDDIQIKKISPQKCPEE